MMVERRGTVANFDGGASESSWLQMWVLLQVSALGIFVGQTRIMSSITWSDASERKV